MPDAQDMDLVRQYARTGSEAAFSELVRRHLDLVYSVAFRFVGNSTDAQDVAQAVFIVLARKAAGLKDRTVLTGWLYETTRFTAMRALRNRARRRAREQEASMETHLTNSEDENVWQQLEPHLESAMARLSAVDRTLLALRYYEHRTGEEAAEALNITAAAAHKRTHRALEKLRGHFLRRGIALSTAALASCLAANSVQAAPVGLAKTISIVGAAGGTAAGGPILELVKGALKIMAWSKTKTAIVVTSGLLFTGGTATVVKRTWFPTIHNAWFQPDVNQAASAPDGLILFRETKLGTREPVHNEVIIVPGYNAGFGTPSVPSWWKKDRPQTLVGRNLPLLDILPIAYNCPTNEMLIRTRIPTNHFDYLVKQEPFDAFGPRLQQKIRNETGIHGEWEEIEVNNWVLKVGNTNLLRVSSGNAGTESDYEERTDEEGRVWRRLKKGVDRTRSYGKNTPIDGLLGYLTAVSGLRVRNATGLDGRYDFRISDLERNADPEEQFENAKYFLADSGLILEKDTSTTTVRRLVIR